MGIRFESIETIWGHAKDTAKRFPGVLLVSLAAFAVALKLIEHDDVVHRTLTRIFALLILAIPVALVVKLICERGSLNVVKAVVLHSVAAAGIIGFYFTYHQSEQSIHWYRWTLLDLSAHLAVAFVLFVPRGSISGFWFFNQTLFIRSLTTVLYSSVIFAGLAIALKALDYLFGIHVSGHSYTDLGAFVGIVFNTWFFLGGVPLLSEVQENGTYPRSIKLFTQYVLVPLVTIYFLILYAYLAKILVTGTWPNGTVGYLVSALSALGIFSILLVHPTRDRDDSRWVKTFSRWFFIALVPLLLLLFAATWKRVSEYGITEPRYFLLLLNTWVFGLSLYYAIRGSRDIRVVPISLCFIALLSSFGPWSAFSVSRASQMRQLTANLTKVGLLHEQTISKLPKGKILNTEDVSKIAGSIRYLNSHHGLFLAQELFPDLVMKATLDDRSEYILNSQMLERLGIDETTNRDAHQNSYLHPPSLNPVTVVTGYDFYYEWTMGDTDKLKGSQVGKFAGKGPAVTISDSTQDGILVVERTSNKDTLTISLNDLVQRLQNIRSEARTDHDFTIEAASKSMKVRVLTTSIWLENKGTKSKLQSATGQILIKLNP